MTGRYDYYTREALIGLLERRDVLQRYGLIREREGIEPDRALNQDYVVFDLDRELSTPPQDARGWRNLVIEGDNWDALRALRLTHAGRIRCILIDPPYNTGNRDFAYNDHFVGKDDRFRHSLWLEFLYRRLVLARDLLADDGVILVCINDENRARLDLLMEQVFPSMRVGTFVWRTRNGSNADQVAYLSVDHEHVLVYAKTAFAFLGDAKNYDLYRNSDDDPRGDWQPVSLRLGFSYKERPNLYYPLVDPITHISYPASPDRVWVYATRDRVKVGQRLQNRPMEELIAEGRIIFPQAQRVVVWESMDSLLKAIDASDVPLSAGAPMLRRGLPNLDYWVGRPVGFGTPRLKLFKTDLRRESKPLSSWISSHSEPAGEGDSVQIKAGSNTEAARNQKAMFGEKMFNFAKPLSLIREIVRQATGPDDVVLDFFAGFATVAHAVLSVNAEDEGNRRFIMVSNTEATAGEQDKNLCRDVCATRIRRAISGYGDVAALGGDFAYLRVRRIREEDLLYELGPTEIWTLLQLRQGFPLRAFDPDSAVQLSLPPRGAEGDPALAYVPIVNNTVISVLRDTQRAMQIFTPTPGMLRDSLGRPGIAIDVVPDRLIGEFRRNVVGL